MIKLNMFAKLLYGFVYIYVIYREMIRKMGRKERERGWLFLFVLIKIMNEKFISINS